MDAYLEGRIAIVTGGFSGIGKAIAGALAERGATIAVGARRLPEEAIGELGKVTDRLFYQRLDVADVDNIDACIDSLAKAYGHPIFW
jgi:NAD(P)-dependent dehydrogenase (short-subunit alcohol dehydrogenase family)